MSQSRRRKKPAIDELLRVMARLRSPTGCPWDREQDHLSLRFHAVEEVYELMDAIETGDDHEMTEELGDLLLQVVFHCQLANERGAFDFDQVARRIVDKLIRRHPHVFGNADAKTVDAVWCDGNRSRKPRSRARSIIVRRRWTASRNICRPCCARRNWSRRRARRSC